MAARKKAEVRTTVRLPEDVKDGVERMAEVEGRSFNRQLSMMLRHVLSAWQAMGEASSPIAGIASGTTPEVKPRRKATKNGEGK